MLGTIHNIVAIPWIYDLTQRLAGGDTGRRVLKSEFTSLSKAGQVLDVGGGTGLCRSMIPTSWTYCCLELDAQKLTGFKAKFPHDEAIEASACDIPKDSESFDLCILVAVAHHLSDSDLEQALGEIKRVLRPGGKFMLMDPIWNPVNLRGRLLWSLDRGDYPRTREKLESALREFFTIQSRRDWKIHHDYSLFWCQKS